MGIISYLCENMGRTGHIRSFLLLLTVIVGMTLTSCGKVGEISITSAGIESITPRGLKGFDAVVLLGIHNPTMEFTVSSVEGNVLHGGSEFATFSADTITVARKSDRVYSLPCSLTLTDRLAVVRLLPSLTSGDMEGITANVTARLRLRSGLRLRLKFKNLDIQEMVSGNTGEVKPDEMEKL